MARQGSPARSGLLLLAAALTPALIGAILIAVQAATLSDRAGGRSDALTYAGVAVAVLLVLGLAGWRLMMQRLAVEPQPADAARGQERDVLVSACLELYDALDSVPLRTELLRALGRVGVSSVEVPAETPFDPTLHKAAGTLPTYSSGLDGRVAETERPGFEDRGRRLRWPEVVVYRAEERRTDGA